MLILEHVTSVTALSPQGQLGYLLQKYVSQAKPMLWTKLVARSLDNASRHFGKREPEHLAVARRGEMEAYFHLRVHGYRIVAKNFRTPHNRGEIDLIGWDHGFSASSKSRPTLTQD